jgi:hypothetical protein
MAVITDPAQVLKILRDLIWKAPHLPVWIPLPRTEPTCPKGGQSPRGSGMGPIASSGHRSSVTITMSPAPGDFRQSPRLTTRIRAASPPSRPIGACVLADVCKAASV